MAARQHETSLLVPDQSECRRLVSLEIVAAVAGVEVGSIGELPGMLVDMTIGAALEFHFEQRVFAFWDVTLHAFQPRVSAL